MLDKETCLHELSRFADLDSELRLSSLDNNDIIVTFSQQGAKVRLTVDIGGGRVIERRGDVEQQHGTYQGLLASPAFGNLKRFVQVQKSILERDAPYIKNIQDHLPIVGELDPRDVAHGDVLLDRIKSWLVQPGQQEKSVRALVVDGPAAIGKTHLIRRLSYDRVLEYGPGKAPPILHVQSRGKQLTTLNDVIAGTLQTMRLSLTFDQVPILVRHKLLQVAIDGFDELVDPNGYDTAWGSLRDFVDDIKGGTIILAGRDTFIDIETVKKAPIGLDSPNTIAVHLRHLKRQEACTWLRAHLWEEDRLRSLENIFEEGSYVLRPFFISEIHKLGANTKDFTSFMTFPLRSLVGSILDREAEILAGHGAVQTDVIRDRLMAFFKEISLDMADSETDVIDESTLALITDMVFENHVPQDVLGGLRHRVKAIVLMESDVVSNRRRFPHTQIQDFFLGLAYLDVLAEGRRPKSLRRNVFGIEFLEIFHDIVVSEPSEKLERFFRGVLKLYRDQVSIDRSQQNIPAIILAAISGYGVVHQDMKRLENLWLGDVVMRGTVPAFTLVSVEFSHLDVRGADISAINFTGCGIGKLTADEETLLPEDFPEPSYLSMGEQGRSKALFGPEEKKTWVKKHKKSANYGESGEIGCNGFGRNGMFEYFNRLCRVINKQGWIRLIKDDRAAALLDDKKWPPIRDLLKKYDLYEEKDNMQAAGLGGYFVRIKRAKEFILRESDDSIIRDVCDEIRALNDMG